MGRYADRDVLIADLLPEVTATAQKDAVGRTLDGVSAFIDKYCNRPANYFDAAGATGTAKLIRGENTRYLRLPQHVAGSVTVTGIDATTYYEGENGWLYFKQPNFITPESSIWYVGRLYEVTARWGYAAIPPAIIEACRQLTLTTWETARGVLGDVTPSGYVVERAMPLSVRETLNLYRRREFEK